MLKLPDTVPVKTRVPLAAWALAATVTLASILVSLLQAVEPTNHASSGAGHGLQTEIASHQAKV